jgi:hypothetical protein
MAFLKVSKTKFVTNKKINQKKSHIGYSAIMMDKVLKNMKKNI